MTVGLLSFAAIGNLNRTVLNVGPQSFANLAKGFGFIVPPANAPDANGYPTVVAAADIGTNPQFIIGYFGDYIHKWSGECSMQIPTASLIRLTQLNGVTTGGVVIGVSGSSGDNSGMTVLNQTAPRVQFAPGAFIQAIAQGSSNGAGGNYIRLTFKTNFVSNFSGAGSPSSRIIKVQNSAQNSTSVQDANAVGTWNYNVIDGSNIDLTTNTATGAVSAWSANFATPGGEALTTPNNMNVNIFGSGNGASSYSGFSNYVFCAIGNESAVTSGQLWDPALVTQYQYLMNSASAPNSQKGWLRFMDFIGTEGSYENDFANRMPVTALSYNATQNFPPAYLTTSANAAITNTGSDAFTCADAIQSVWGGSDYIDLAVVQGTLGAANADVNPTLAVGGHPARPVFDFTTHPYQFYFTSAPASAGLTMQWTFTASWLPGGAYVFSYITVAGDVGNLGTLQGNLVNTLQADATLAAAKMFFGNSGNVTAFPRTSAAGTLTISYTSGPAIAKMGRLVAGAMPSGGTMSFIYSKVLGGWIYRQPPGLIQGIILSYPFEAAVQLCNQVGAHCYWNWPAYTTPAFITAVTNFFGDAVTGLTSGLRFGTETGNENWNFSGGGITPGICEYNGLALGFPGGNEPNISWTALRSVQYSLYSTPAWTGKGRSASDHYIFFMENMSVAFPGQDYENQGLKGASLNPSANTIYSTYGGFGTFSAADYSTAPNRPADKYLTATGVAPYWFSDYIEDSVFGIFGTVADNSIWLQASLDYTNGNTATAFAALTNMFVVPRGSVAITSGSYNNSTGLVTLTLAGPINVTTQPASGDIIYFYGLTGTGISNINQNGGFVAGAATSGTTVTFTIASSLGVGAVVITGGTFMDRTASGVNPLQSSNWTAIARFFANLDNVCAGYDSNRAAQTPSLPPLGLFCYEGAPQWSVSNSNVNGTNGTGSTWYADLVTQLTNLGWNVNAFDALGGTGSVAITHVANQVVNMLQGWKYDTANSGAAASTGSYKSMIKTYFYGALKSAATNGREARAGQYGYQGNIWGFFPVSYSQGGQYTSYDAMHEFNQ